MKGGDDDKCNDVFIYKCMANKFYEYLEKNTELKPNSIMKYCSAIKSISDRMKQRGLINTNLFYINKLKEFEKYYYIILNDPYFIEFNERGHKMYSNALRHFKNYLNNI